MTWVLVAAAAISELCNVASPAQPRDPAESATYTEVGDEASAAGDPSIAIVAYRKAVALDPTNQRAAEALAVLCKATPVADEAETLLAAIARYRKGDRDGARAELTALAGRQSETAAGAHFFLGLIALELHDRRTAERELALARRDPEYADLAFDLLRLARRDGAIAGMVLLLPELDTNPQQLPDTPPMDSTTGPRQSDADMLLAGSLTLRPWPWLALRNNLAWREQLVLDDLDFLGENPQVAVEGVRGADRGGIRYDFNYDLLHRTAYLFAHRVTASYRRELGDVAATASYSARHRDYVQPAQAPFTGWVHAADVGATVRFGQRVELDARAIGWREITVDPVFASIAGGGQLAVRARPVSRLRVTAQTSLWFARYDEPEPDGKLRRDRHVDGSVDVEIDLGDHVIALAGASVARNGSSIEDFRYWKLTARCGLAFALGGP